MFLLFRKFYKILLISFILLSFAGFGIFLQQSDYPKDRANNNVLEVDTHNIASKIEIDEFPSPNNSQQVVLPKSTSKQQDFEQILASLRNNSSQVYTVNLADESLTLERVQRLKEVVDNNSIIGYIQWGEIPADCEEIKAQIEEKLVSNILGYTYYPTDYIHGLLSYHVYKNPKLGQKVNLPVVSKEVGHRLPSSMHTTWKVAQVKDDSKQTGYYSALYINETTHQAVLAFQGTKVEGLKDLVRKNSDLREDIDGVLGNAITQQNALAYVATKEAVDYAKEKEYNLSITGHSLGGYLAELSVAFCYRDFGYRQVKGIVFDSPGTVNKLDKFKSNVINKATKFSIASLPIVSYLSAPNLINTCNGHPGEVYRVYPQLMWSEEIKKWIKRAKRVPLLGTKIRSMDKGLLAVTGHSLATILKMFDPTTGKPSTYIRIADWPKIDTDNVAYIGKQKQELEKKSFLGSAFSIITGKTNIIGDAFEILPSLIGGTTASVLSVLKDYLNIDQTQYWTTLAYLDENYKETNLDADKEFALRYKGHYRVSDRAMNEHVLYVENYEGVDWYLYKLYKYKDKLEQSPSKDITFAVLQKILKDYDVVSLDDHPYMRLANQEIRVEALRDRMQRCIKVLSTISIKKAIEESTIYVLTKQLEKRSIQQFTQLHTYIAQAKSSTYLLREDKQQELIQKLTKDGICVVTGHGGVGKSTLVAQYGHNQKDKQLVWWMPAETPEKLLKSYQDLAQELGIDYKKLAEEYKQSNNQYLSELSRKVYNALVERKQLVLLILDNAADISLVASCLLHRPDLVQVIITTRKAKEFSAYSQVTLAAFKKEEGERFIKKYFETKLYQPSQQEVAALIEEVGLIPQKLALAVGYIGQKRLMTVQGYINKLREIKQSGKQGDKQFVLPEVSLGLESLELQSQLVMRYGAYLDPDFIPLSLISALIEVKDEEELEALLDKLEGLSLITIIKGERSELGIQIHREVQAASKRYQGWINANSLTEEEVLLAIIKVLHERMPIVTAVPDSTWDQAKMYATNVAHVLGHIQEGFKPTPLLADLISRLGNYNQQVERNFEQALKYNQQALVIRQSLYPNNNAAVATSLSSLGGLYLGLGNYKEALSYYQQAYEMQKHLYKGNHPSIASSLSSIGDAYNMLGQDQEALKYLKQALEMEKHLYTGNHLSIASLFNSLGNVYQALGKFVKALKYYEKALEMIRALHIGNHPSTAVYLNNLGLLYKRLDQYQEALKYFEQALEMQQKLYTGNHPSIATSLYNLGGCYHVLNQYQEALKYYQQALKMFKSLYLNNHPFVAVTLSNIGNVYEALGDYQEALKYDQQALEIMKVLYTDNHINIAVTLSNIGGVYQSLGDHQEALRYYQDALEIMKKLYTGNHFDIAISVNNVGNAYKSLGKYEEALKYYHQSLEMLKILFVGDHSDIAIVLNNIGNAYKALGDYKEALKYHQESLAMKRVLYTGNHVEITISLNNIGDIYQELGDYKKALKYHQEALVMNKIIYTGNHTEIAVSLNNIGTSYKALGEYKEALNYHQQALEMMKMLYTGNHFYIAISFNNIGSVYKALGDYKEALKYYQQALEMFQAIYKDNNPNIAIALTNIGAVYQALGKYEEALKYYQQALEMRQALYSSKHPDIIRSLNKLGDIYKALGDEQQSLKYYQQALEMK